MAAVASIAVPVFAAALFVVSAVTQGSVAHAALALTALVLAVIGAGLYMRYKDDEEVEEPTTGQVVVLALGVVLVMVWGALLVTTVQVTDTTAEIPPYDLSYEEDEYFVYAPDFDDPKVVDESISKKLGDFFSNLFGVSKERDDEQFLDDY